MFFGSGGAAKHRSDRIGATTTGRSASEDAGEGIDSIERLPIGKALAPDVAFAVELTGVEAFVHFSN